MRASVLQHTSDMDAIVAERCRHGLARLAEPIGPHPGALDPAIRFRACPIDGIPWELLKQEELTLLPAGVADVRRREFAAGRVCCRAAMAALGLRDQPVWAASDRSPIWPAGVVGSISHSKGWAAAAVALRSDGIRAVGLDLEEAVPLEADLIPEICVKAERDWLATQPQSERGMLAKAIFCAKEAAYKCQYPVSKCVFGFDVLQVELDMVDGRFSAAFLTNVRPFRKGEALSGSVQISAGQVVASLSLH